MIDPESQYEFQSNQLESARVKFRAHKFFLVRLDRQVERGLISPQERVDLIATALLRKQTVTQEAREIALTDPLTGLPNRRAFETSLSSLVKKKKLFGVLLLDLDHFKDVNDTYGHSAGDSVAIQVCMILSSNVREEGEREETVDMVSRISIVGRIGGDEFAMLLPGVSNAEDLRDIAERIRTSISSQPFQVKNEKGEEIEYPVTVSIGGGIYTGDQGHNEFLDKIDKEALYKAKGKNGEDGRNRTVILPMKRSDEIAA